MKINVDATIGALTLRAMKATPHLLVGVGDLGRIARLSQPTVRARIRNRRIKPSYIGAAAEPLWLASELPNLKRAIS